MKLTKKEKEEIKIFKSLPIFRKNKNDPNCFLEIKPYFAKTNKNIWCEICRANSICLDNYLLIKKNTIVACYDQILDPKAYDSVDGMFTSKNIRIYVRDNNSFYITRTHFKNLSLIGKL